MTLAVTQLRACEDSVMIQFETQQTWGLWLTRMRAEDGGGQLQVDTATEHLVIATGSLVGLKKGSVVMFTEKPEYGGETHTRKVQRVVRKDDDRALSRVFVEKP